MCMKYINVNVQCFESVSNSILGLGRTTFSSMIGSVKSKEKHGKYIVDDFNVVTFVNIRGTKDAKNPENPLDSGKKMCFRVRLTKLDEKEENQLSYDLKDFEIDLSDKKLIHHACFDYVERTEIVKVEDLVLESQGAYVIKVLVKDENEEKFNVQMTHPLYIN